MPVLDPLDGPAKRQREERHDDLLGIQTQLAAEGAPHVRRDHADAFLAAAEHLRETRADAVRICVNE